MTTSDEIAEHYWRTAGPAPREAMSAQPG
jgi:hypothetical protein